MTPHVGSRLELGVCLFACVIACVWDVFFGLFDFVLTLAVFKRSYIKDMVTLPSSLEVYSREPSPRTAWKNKSNRVVVCLITFGRGLSTAR